MLARGTLPTVRLTIDKQTRKSLFPTKKPGSFSLLRKFKSHYLLLLNQTWFPLTGCDLCVTLSTFYHGILKTSKQTRYRGCQRTPRTLTSLVSVDPPSASAQAAPPSPTPEASVGTCPVDPDKQCAGVPATAKATGACTCDCLPGWTGVDCSVCTADDVCQVRSRMRIPARCL